jgi:uncharacterized protein (DUF2249 family)
MARGEAAAFGGLLNSIFKFGEVESGPSLWKIEMHEVAHKKLVRQGDTITPLNEMPM